MPAGFAASASWRATWPAPCRPSRAWRRNWWWATAPAAGARRTYGAAELARLARRYGLAVEAGYGSLFRAARGDAHARARGGRPARGHAGGAHRGDGIQPAAHPARRSALSALRACRRSQPAGLASAVARRGIRARPGRFSGLGQGSHPGFGKARNGRRGAGAGPPHRARPTARGTLRRAAGFAGPVPSRGPGAAAADCGGRGIERAVAGSARPKWCAASACGWKSGAAGRG
jgi:hypothetical protein